MKCECSSPVMSSVKPEEASLLFTILTSLKYKFVLHLLRGWVQSIGFSIQRHHKIF